MSHLHEASKALVQNKTLTTLNLIGGYECNLDRPWAVDLFVTGGAIVQKNLCIGQGLDIGDDLFVGGNLTVCGQTTISKSEVVIIQDKNICLGNVTGMPSSDDTANGGGIILLGPLPDESKSFIWYKDGPYWNSNQDINLGYGRLGSNPNEGCGDDVGLRGTAYRIDGNLVLAYDRLGPTVLSSNLEKVGVLRVGSIDNGILINSITIGNPPVITTNEPHNLVSGDYVYIKGTNSTPILDGCKVVTVLTPTTFTVPSVTVGSGTLGYVQADNFSIDIGISDLISGRHIIRCGKDFEILDITSTPRFSVKGMTGQTTIDNVTDQDYALKVSSNYPGSFATSQRALYVTNTTDNGTLVGESASIDIEQSYDGTNTSFGNNNNTIQSVGQRINSKVNFKIPTPWISSRGIDITSTSVNNFGSNMGIYAESGGLAGMQESVGLFGLANDALLRVGVAGCINETRNEIADRFKTKAMMPGGFHTAVYACNPDIGANDYALYVDGKTYINGNLIVYDDITANTIMADYIIADTIIANRVNEGFKDVTIVTSYMINDTDPPKIRFLATTFNNTVILPDATTLPKGWITHIFNNSSSNAYLDLQDATSTTYTYIGISEHTFLELVDNTTISGNWRNFHLKDTNILQVRKNGGQFASIKDAVNYAGPLASISNPYIVDIGPGDFFEDPIECRSYVHLTGVSGTNIIPTANTNTIIIANSHCILSFLGLYAANASGGIGIKVQDVQDFNIIHVTVFDCDIAIDVGAPTQDTETSIFNSLILNPRTLGIKSDGNFGHTSKIALYSSNFVGIPSTQNLLEINGPDASIILTLANFKDVVNGTAIYLDNAPMLSCSSTYISNCHTGIILDNNGLAPHIDAEALNINDDVVNHFIVNHPDSTGVVRGIFTSNKSIFSDGITLNFTDKEFNSSHIIGNLFLGYKHTKEYEAFDLLDKSSVSGVLEGGNITGNGNNAIIVGGGIGYTHDDQFPSKHYVTKVEWNDTNVPLTSNALNFIYVTNTANVVASTAELDNHKNIYLASTYVQDDQILFIDPSGILVDEIDNRYDDMIRDTIGPLVSGGIIVTENQYANLKIDITGGIYYLSSVKYQTTGGSNIAFAQLYNSNSNWTITLTDTLLHDKFNNSGTLTTMTNGYYAKHSIYGVADDINEKYFVVVADQEYSTLQNAVDGNLPQKPGFFTQGVILLSSAIVQSNNNSIIQFIDQRPIFGTAASGGGASGVTDHGSLTGLADDDHLQYLLVNGSRAMSGDLDLGSNDIINAKTLATVDYIDFDLTAGIPATPREARLYYDNAIDALSYKPGVSGLPVTVNLGQETIIRIYNNTGGSIFEGQPVYFTGLFGTTPTVDLAIANSFITSQVGGIAKHEIPNNTYGFVTKLGNVSHVNTAAFSPGDKIYLSETVAGSFQTNMPSSGYPVILGTCVVSDATSGSMQVHIDPVPGLVKVSYNDTTPKNLLEALTSNSGFITLTQINDSGNEMLSLDLASNISVNMITANIANINGPLTVQGNAQINANVTIDNDLFVSGNIYGYVVSKKFDGYYFPAGVETIILSTPVDVPIDVNRKIDPDFTHIPSDANVTINTTGTYFITARATTHLTAATGVARAESQLIIQLNGVDVPGTTGSMTNASLNQGSSSATVSAILDLTAGDKLKIQVTKVSSFGVNTVRLLTGGCGMTINNI